MNSNNQMIQKGKISSVEGKADRNGDKTTARVLPSTADSMVTRPLTIPWYLRGEMGNLTPGTEVAYAMFEDGTGIILSRMDGECKAGRRKSKSPPVTVREPICALVLQKWIK